jgi:hypothetical protein
LIGGTAPFKSPAGSEVWSLLLFLLFLALFKFLGEDTLGGGVAVRWISCGGGVGIGGAGGAMDFSDAFE